MKTSHLIFLSTILFIILFYQQSGIGINLGLFGFAITILNFFITKKELHTRTFYFLFITSLISDVAFAWFGDFPSFMAVVISIVLFRMASKGKRIHYVLSVLIIPTNIFTFIFRVLMFDKWLKLGDGKGNGKKIFAYILVPMFFILVFFGIYSLGSSHFENILTMWNWNFDFFQLILISLLGFFFCFNIWNLTIDRFIYKQNRKLANDFDKNKIEIKPTYSFFDLDLERNSGVISLIGLNILLVFFIISYNYEQFFEATKSTLLDANQLSIETHERVNAVIMSIVMAVIVLMFYFKSGFNFDEKAGKLKLLAKVWIFLNAILVISASVKNTEYIVGLGLTYKRLGVYAFLLLCLLGLFFTFVKIQKRKTNAFLFNQMSWCLYITILICSSVNWGSIITAHNMKRKDFAVSFHFYDINFSERQLMHYADEKKDQTLKREILERIKLKNDVSLLSGTGYYKTIYDDK